MTRLSEPVRLRQGTGTEGILAAQPSARTRVARYFDRFIFYALLVVIALTAIPYGTVEPWWKAVFQCAVFVLGLLWMIEGKLSGTWFVRQHRLLLPLVALVAFTLIQALLPLRSGLSGSDLSTGLHPISFAPYDTKMVTLQLMALIVVAALLLRYTTNRRRLMALVYVVIGIGLASAVFGLVRMAFQHKTGFLLPHLQLNDGTVSRGVGFAQFINNNHFAFLAEMSLGLLLGLMLRRPHKLARLVIGLAIAIPMWIAIVYSGSRGGLVSMLAQVLFVALLVFIAGPLISGRARQELRDDSRQVLRIGSLLVTRTILIASFLIVMVVGIVWVGGDPLATRLESVSKEFGVQESDKYSNTMRSKIWAATWQLIRNHPFTGVGFGAYWIAITHYHRASGEFTPQQAHNDYLEILASGGLIGVVVGLWFIALFLKEFVLRFRSSDAVLSAYSVGALAGIFTVALHSVVDFGLHITINAVICTALIAVATIPIGSDESHGLRQAQSS